MLVLDGICHLPEKTASKMTVYPSLFIWSVLVISFSKYTPESEPSGYKLSRLLAIALHALLVALESQKLMMCEAA
jgi:hypothetical protein